MSRLVSSILAAGIVLFGSLSGAPLSANPTHADGLNLCAPSNQHAVLISLPADEAPHVVPVEWYYTAGHLVTLTGKRYGFEAVVFQFNIPFLTRATIGQVAVTDLNSRTFHHQTYALPGLFPTSTDSFSVTLPGELSMSGGNGWNHISASLPDGYHLNLSLGSLSNPVYQNGNGLVPYVDPSTGKVIARQYYYSRPRMATFGTVTSPDGTAIVRGESWFDHEYGVLPEQIDWEWYSIQLNDGSNITAYTVRQFHTQHDYAKFGSIQDPLPGCAVQSLGASDFTMSLRGTWTSPHTGIIYPNQFGLTVPSRGMTLTLMPELADQEVTNTTGIVPPYWEGAVRVRGIKNGRLVSGVGYVELVEY